MYPSPPNTSYLGQGFSNFPLHMSSRRMGHTETDSDSAGRGQGQRFNSLAMPALEGLRLPLPANAEFGPGTGVREKTLRLLESEGQAVGALPRCHVAVVEFP